MDVRVETPYPDCAVPRIWTWFQEFRWRVADDFTPATLEAWVEHWRARERTQQSWAVYVDDDLGGVVTVEPQSPCTATASCIFRRDCWRREIMVPALQQVYLQVFESGITRIQSFVFNDNAQVLCLMRQLGSHKEGVLRRQTLRNGRPTDMMVIGLLSGEFISGNGGQ